MSTSEELSAPRLLRITLDARLQSQKVDSLASGEVHLKALVSEQRVRESLDLLNARSGYPFD